ncbi:MAG: type II toxin-antitoxin system RelE/ParE family toxin [Flavobacteriaceae bacterium]|nr:type II toxin-antitoxin system RelE/ParE family toxin [Flavobacteriaceae bacterium]
MGLEVYWLELAENKLEDIYSYYSVKASKRVAEKLITGIVDATIGIEKQPEIGQIEVALKHKEQEFRYLVFKNYKIVYWINDNFKRIEIANVFDTRQDPEKINETK